MHLVHCRFLLNNGEYHFASIFTGAFDEHPSPRLCLVDESQQRLEGKPDRLDLTVRLQRNLQPVERLAALRSKLEIDPSDVPASCHDTPLLPPGLFQRERPALRERPKQRPAHAGSRSRRVPSRRR